MTLFRRFVQLASLTIFFLFLLSAASTFLAFMLPLDLFLRLDPALTATTAIATRNLSLVFMPAVILVLLGLIFGRAFCGYICPMGTTLDGGEKLFGRARKKRKGPDNKWRAFKYLVMLFLAGASFFSVSFVFWASPISLITRFYGLLVQPVIAYLFNELFNLSMPLIEWLDITPLLFAQIDTPRFNTLPFILAFFVFFSVLSPRFWCRFLCPSGALLALTSKKPLFRRHVSKNCTSCGKCARACPMEAIPEDDYISTRHEECLLCQTCKKLCPEKAVTFLFKKDKQEVKTLKMLPDRRKFIISGLSGAGTALVCMTGLEAPYNKDEKGKVLPPALIRPPAALPEREFLARCIRCGECMVACPTNTLQPLWLKAGFLGMFTPTLIFRRGFCNPECHKCSEMCPTGAIRSLSRDERKWAKIGTAEILHHKCLAWEHQKSCMVCDEVCPSDAVKFKKEPGNPVTVPHVIENKCTGCGYCEHHCPVQNKSAIIISPMGELRLAEGSFIEEGKNLGLDITFKLEGNNELPAAYREGGPDGTAQPPGFETDGEELLAPGFDD